MGIHGNSTCVLDYDDAIGYLCGAENKGLAAMFVMMNVARLGVGVQGLSQSEVAYQNGAAYAKERLQGRSITGAKNPDGPADPIIVHPDIRRMLMDAKAFNEGARAFAFWTALYGDLLTNSPDEQVREKADDYMALMTPVIKSYLTDKGYANATNCQQIFGGHGYIEEHGMSQFVRDARIAMIYEGTNGRQRLNLWLHWIRLIQPVDNPYADQSTNTNQDFRGDCAPSCDGKYGRCIYKRMPQNRRDQPHNFLA
jgi:alkylation response protein AidB-like acyl-CoA dehydrogenase